MAETTHIGKPERIIEVIPIDEPIIIPSEEPLPETEPVKEPEEVPS